MTITLDNLKDVIHYDQKTGHFRWRKRVRRKRMTSQYAGSLNPCGYIQICVKQKVYKAHRLAWFYMHGEWPGGALDHINGKKDDNRICNLRPANHSQNQANTKLRSNSTSGLKGIFFNKHVGFWYARITVNYKQIHLGCSRDKYEAHHMYARAAEKYFGEFARTQ